MTTARERGYRPWRRFIKGPDAVARDAIKTDLGVARRRTVLASLDLVLRELENPRLSKSEAAEITARANTLRNLLGQPAK